MGKSANERTATAVGAEVISLNPTQYQPLNEESARTALYKTPNIEATSGWRTMSVSPRRHDGDIVHALKFVGDRVQAGEIRQQVGLRRVAGDDHGRVPAEARQQHLDLAVGAVLRFVDDDEGVVQRAAAHEADRRDFDQAFGHQRFEAFGGEAIGQRVVERAQVGREFVFHRAGQIAERFAGFHRGS